MTYTVKEIFLTQQGEGANIGRTAVFVRFSGCNLWSGREEDREKAICRFCDTDFVGGEKHETAYHLLLAVQRAWRGGWRNRMVVLTGGEPLLQVDAALIETLRHRGFYVAVETNGTQKLPADVDWICVSPKAGTKLVLSHADEIKLVFPQVSAGPSRFHDYPAKFRWLSPMDGPNRAENTRLAAEYCASNPEWRLAIQAHKTWGIP